MRERMSLGRLALAHFWVDFSCALLMFSRIRGAEEFGLCLLLYNFCAFALQMPLGLLADRWDRNIPTAALGCALVALGWAIAPAAVPASVTAGLGNALFHIGGGVQVLNASRERASALGIFVSPGALGIYFGTLLGKSGDFSPWVPVGGLLLLAAALPWMERRERDTPRSGNAPVELTAEGRVWGVLACLFLVVVLRSYVGMILVFPWKSGPWALAATLALVLGKAAGGFLGDRLGMMGASAASLGASALLFCFSGHPVAGTAAVLLFNMSMPITLWAAAKLLPGGKGFAFGLLTFGLFLGYLPVWLGLPPVLAGPGGYALGALTSLGLLAAGLKGGRL